MEHGESLDGSSDSLTTAFEVLSNDQRRQILFELLEEYPQKDDVSLRLGTDSELRLTAEVMLFNSHLPKLEDYGLIEWNREEGVITKGPQFDEIRPVLERLEPYHAELLEDVSS